MRRQRWLAVAALAAVVGWLVGPAAGALMNDIGLVRGPLCATWENGTCSPPPHPIWFRLGAALALGIAAFVGARRLDRHTGVGDRRQPIVVLSAVLVLAGVTYAASNALVPQHAALGRSAAQGCRPFGAAAAWVVTTGEGSSSEAAAAVDRCITQARVRVAIGAITAGLGGAFLWAARSRRHRPPPPSSDVAAA